MTRRELSQLVAGVKREALREAAAEVGEKLGYARLDLELVNSSIVDLRIDGYQVNNPIDFKGRNVEMTVFMIFAPWCTSVPSERLPSGWIWIWWGWWQNLLPSLPAPLQMKHMN